MSTRNITFSIVGIITGLLINHLGNWIYSRLRITNRAVKILGQIVLCSVFLAYIQTEVNRNFALEWQNVTPGIFFTAFFFGVQYVSFTEIEDMYGISRI
jgi:uncharacterized protein YacL